MTSNSQPIMPNQTNVQDVQPQGAELSSTPPVRSQTPGFQAPGFQVETPAVEAKPSLEVAPSSPQLESSTREQSNSALTRLLIGGLVGATVGTLIGALANRRTSQGLNHSAEGVGRAFKTIGDGLGQAAHGVGDAVKSVSEGVSYAVVGSTQDAAAGIAEGTEQVKESSTDVVQSGAQQVSQAVKEIAEGTQRLKNDATVAAAEAIQTTADQANRAIGKLARGTQQAKVTAAETAKTVADPVDDAVQSTADAAKATSASMRQAVDQKADQTARAQTMPEAPSVSEPSVEAASAHDLFADIEANIEISEDGRDGREIRDDFFDAASAGFVKEDVIDISPQPDPFPSVEVSRPDHKSKGK
ncbi:MAG TPA: hypothetical protein V6D06_06820 [Trichocoleus sp.]